MRKIRAAVVFLCFICVVCGFLYLFRGLRRHKELEELLKARRKEASDHRMTAEGIETWSNDVKTAAGCFVCSFLMPVFYAIRWWKVDMSERELREGIEERIRQSASAQEETASG